MYLISAQQHYSSPNSGNNKQKSGNEAATSGNETANFGLPKLRGQKNKIRRSEKRKNVRIWCKSGHFLTSNVRYFY